MKSSYYERNLSVSSLSVINKLRNTRKDSILNKIKNLASNIVKQFGSRNHISLSDFGIDFNIGFLELVKPILIDNKIKNKKIKNNI